MLRKVACPIPHLALHLQSQSYHSHGHPMTLWWLKPSGVLGQGSLLGVHLYVGEGCPEEGCSCLG